MTAARELAFELSQLPEPQREQLLAELPADRRIAMETLVAQIPGLLGAAPDHFERHMQSAEAQRSLQSFAGLNDGQLRLLLGGEHESVQRRVTAAIRNRYPVGLPAAVDGAITEYLAHRIQTTEIHSHGGTAAPRRWWRKWMGARR